MTSKEIDAVIKWVGCLSVTSLDGDTMHSRIISMCGIYPSGRKEGKNKDGHPYWPPGFFLRITGKTREIPEDEVREKAAAGSRIHQYALEDAERYPSMKLFCVYKGKGEVFDYDFEMENRDHKVLRNRFAFGAETVNEAGARIDPDKCNACGECYEVCTFKAIEEGEPYTVISERCDECGSCILTCPIEAIDHSQTM